MIRKGDTVRIKPEWQDEGDSELVWIALSDEEKGRVDIQSNDPRLMNLPIRPFQTVSRYMLE